MYIASQVYIYTIEESIADQFYTIKIMAGNYFKIEINAAL